MAVPQPVEATYRLKQSDGTYRDVSYSQVAVSGNSVTEYQPFIYAKGDKELVNLNPVRNYEVDEAGNIVKERNYSYSSNGQRLLNTSVNDYSKGTAREIDSNRGNTVVAPQQQASSGTLGKVAVAASSNVGYYLVDPKTGRATQVSQQVSQAFQASVKSGTDEARAATAALSAQRVLSQVSSSGSNSAQGARLQRLQNEGKISQDAAQIITRGKVVSSSARDIPYTPEMQVPGQLAGAQEPLRNLIRDPLTGQLVPTETVAPEQRVVRRYDLDSKDTRIYDKTGKDITDQYGGQTKQFTINKRTGQVSVAAPGEPAITQYSVNDGGQKPMFSRAESVALVKSGRAPELDDAPYNQARFDFIAANVQSSLGSGFIAAVPGIFAIEKQSFDFIKTVAGLRTQEFGQEMSVGTVRGKKLVGVRFEDQPGLNKAFYGLTLPAVAVVRFTDSLKQGGKTLTELPDINERFLAATQQSLELSRNSTISSVPAQTFWLQAGKTTGQALMPFSKLSSSVAPAAVFAGEFLETPIRSPALVGFSYKFGELLKGSSIVGENLVAKGAPKLIRTVNVVGSKIPVVNRFIDTTPTGVARGSAIILRATRGAELVGTVGLGALSVRGIMGEIQAEREAGNQFATSTVLGRTAPLFWAGASGARNAKQNLYLIQKETDILSTRYETGLELFNAVKQGKIQPSFQNENLVLKQAKILEMKDESGKLLGRAEYFLDADRSIRILDIGSYKKGYGTRLINEIQARNPSRSLSAHSIPDAKGFYDKLGFKRDPFFGKDINVMKRDAPYKSISPQQKADSVVQAQEVYYNEFMPRIQAMRKNVLPAERELRLNNYNAQKIEPNQNQRNALYDIEDFLKSKEGKRFITYGTGANRAYGQDAQYGDIDAYYKMRPLERMSDAGEQIVAFLKSRRIERVGYKTGLVEVDPKGGLQFTETNQATGFKMPSVSEIQTNLFRNTEAVQITVDGKVVMELHSVAGRTIFAPIQKTPQGTNVVGFFEQQLGKFEASFRLYRSGKDIPALIESVGFYETKTNVANTKQFVPFEFSEGIFATTPESGGARVLQGVKGTIAIPKGSSQQYKAIFPEFIYGGSEANAPAFLQPIIPSVLPVQTTPVVPSVFLQPKIPSTVLRRPSRPTPSLKTQVSQTALVEPSNIPSTKMSSPSIRTPSLRVPSPSLSMPSPSLPALPSLSIPSPRPSISPSPSQPPSIPTPFAPPFFNMGGGMGRRGRGRTRFKLPQARYAPSLAAIDLNITSTEKPKYLTGIEVRPIIVPKSFKKGKVRVKSLL